MRNQIVKVTCRHCGTKINIAEAGDHLAVCDAATIVHSAIKAEYTETIRRLRTTANECSLGYSE
jgi:hypothetical protein